VLGTRGAAGFHAIGAEVPGNPLVVSGVADFFQLNDLVGKGIVPGMAHPGGHATGVVDLVT
jgi:hypothetical protein